MADKDKKFDKNKKFGPKKTSSDSSPFGAGVIIVIVLVLILGSIFVGSLGDQGPGVGQIGNDIRPLTDIGSETSTFSAGGVIKGIISFVWWPIFFFIAFAFWKSAWITWRQKRFEKRAPQVLLEIKIPREIITGPRGMDQFFQAVNRLKNEPSTFNEKYNYGETTRWYTFELVSFGGEIHFYMRVYKKQVGLVESALLSYYPDLEIKEVEDYVYGRFPKGNYADYLNNGYDLWGSEMILNKPPMYPIRSYKDFETPDESQKIDPIGVFLEVLAKLKPTEIAAVQYNISPIGSKWSKKYIKDLENLKKPKRYDAEDDSGFPMMAMKSESERRVIEAIENNLAKPAFRAVTRFIYISPKSTFYDSFARRGLKGAFNQYGTNDLNSFGENFGISTRTQIWYPPYVFPKTRNVLRHQRILNFYREREFMTEPFIGKLLSSHIFNWNFHSQWSILSTESMATLFHPPTEITLTAPHTQRVESRRGGAQAGLPIYADEAVLEQFNK